MKDDGITSKIYRAISEYRMRRGRVPQYVVLDSDSFLQCVTETYLPPTLRGLGLISEAAQLPDPPEDTDIGLTEVRIMGLIAVVIPTDGLPMLRVAGWAAQEAIDLTRESREPC